MNKKTETKYENFFENYKKDNFENFEKENPQYFKEIASKSKNFISKLKGCISNGKKITIYGDYDVDGIGATSTLFEMIKDFGVWAGDTKIANRITLAIPSREDGYGISKDLLEFHLAKSDMVFCVDNGSHHGFLNEVKDDEDIANKLFVIDHHPNGDFKDVPFVLNPNDGKFQISTGYLLDMVYKILLKEHPDYAKASSPDRYSDLIALTLISDMADLNNVRVRKTIKEGLAKIGEKERYFYKELFSKKNPDVSFEDVAFKINPMLNSVGRLSSKPIGAVYMLLYKNRNKSARETFDAISLINTKRKEILNHYSDLALNDYAQNGNKDGNIVYYFHKDIPMGVNGLIAQKLYEKTGKPALVASENISQENQITGSGRGENIKAMLRSIEDKSVLDFGGHEGALGFRIYNSDEFAKKINEIDSNPEFKKDNSHVNIPGTLLDNVFTATEYERLSEIYSKSTDNIPFQSGMFALIKDADIKIDRRFGNNFCSAAILDRNTQKKLFNVLLKTSVVEEHNANKNEYFALKLFNGCKEIALKNGKIIKRKPNYTSDLIIGNFNEKVKEFELSRKLEETPELDCKNEAEQNNDEVPLFELERGA